MKLPENIRDSSLKWQCRGLRQGLYILEKCYLETSSPLGFWAVRSSAPIRTEIRVYPDLLSERHALSSFFLRQSMGIHTQRQVGKGREFDRVLIIPHGPIKKYLRNGDLKHVQGSLAKFYVAVTRAKHSVAFLHDGMCSVDCTEWQPSGTHGNGLP